LKNTKNVRLYKRYSVVLRYFEGFTNRKIAEMENIDKHTVGSYIKNYKANKLEGLNIGYSCGKKEE
jgi:transposase